MNTRVISPVIANNRQFLVYRRAGIQIKEEDFARILCFLQQRNTLLVIPRILGIFLQRCNGTYKLLAKNQSVRAIAPAGKIFYRSSLVAKVFGVEQPLDFYLVNFKNPKADLYALELTLCLQIHNWNAARVPY